MARRVLVTGAGGFIGRTSLAPLHSRGFEVHAVHSPRRAGRQEPGTPGVTVHHVDLLNPGAIDALIALVSPTHLLHFAWIATPGEYWDSADNERWLEAGTHLAKRFYSEGGERAVMAGSCAEYNWTRVEVCREEASPLADEDGTVPSQYSSAKLKMHRRLSSISGAQEGSYAWGRVFFQFGPGEGEARLVPTVVRSLLAGREARCTAGNQLRSFLHVADVGAAFATLLDGAFEGPVNIGSGEPVTVAALIGAIARKLGREDLVRLGALESPAGEPPKLLPDVTRLNETVGFQPHYDLDAAIEDTIAWWRAREGHA